MPYKLYSKKNIEKEVLTLKEVKAEFDRQPNKLINNISFKQFIDHVLQVEEKEKLTKEYDKFISYPNFYLLRYSNYYSEKDVKILVEGMLTFGKNIYREFSFRLSDCVPKNNNHEIHHFIIFHYLTISSLSHDYMLKQGVYKNTTMVKNSVDKFIKKGIKGGKVMCYQNKPQRYMIKDFKTTLPINDVKNANKTNFDEYIVDYDAVSCYPSAMYAMDGVPKGKPVLLDPKTDLNTLTGHYYFSMKLTSFKRYSSFPSISVLKNGVKHYLNQVPDELLYGDKYYFKELMKNHELTSYEIKTLIYFPDGYDPKINSVIKELFDIRVKLKKQQNQLEQVYKLILNSVYGKTIMKQSNKKVEFFNGTEKEMFEAWQNKAYLNLSITQINHNQYIFTYNDYNDYFSLSHIGVIILSYSKLMMLEILYLADQLDIKIFYTDTDSIHLRYQDLLKLMSHRPNLTGNNLGQFHRDYKMKNFDIVFGIAKIALNKKEYCVILEGINSKTGDVHRQEIFRYKGLKEEAVKIYAKKWVIENQIRTNFPVFELFNSNQQHLIEQVTENGMQLKVYNKGLISESLKSVLKVADFRLNKMFLSI